MRIAYDHQIFGWQRFGGVSRYVFEVANHLAEAEENSIHCHIVCPFHVNEYLRRANPKLKVTGIHAPAGIADGRPPGRCGLKPPCNAQRRLHPACRSR
jgi:hypothetical protein